MGQIAVPNDILADLKRLASVRGQTVDAFAETLLRQALGQEALPSAARAAFEAIAAMTPEGVHQTDSVALIREERDR